MKGGLAHAAPPHAQLPPVGLKLLANVTYGYTSASFSGRMPCVHLADAIVETGRRTLERAIAMVNSGDGGRKGRARRVRRH